MSTSGFLRAPLDAASPVGPFASLLDAAVRPGPGEVDAGGNPLAFTTTMADGSTVVRGYRWEGGFRWLPRLCAPFGARNECAPLVISAYGPAEVDDVLLEHQPVILSAESPCPSVMSNDYPFKRQSAIDALIAAEAKSAERELWGGDLARAAITAGDHSYDRNRWLTRHGVAEDVTPTPGTAVSIMRGIGLLEDFLADTGYGGRGMIHARPSVSAHVPWDVRPNGPVLSTVRGTYLVFGVGYTGAGPAASDGGAPVAADAGETWLFATDRVVYRQGEIQVIPDVEAEALDRSTNDEVVYAQRSSAGTFDLCTAGAVLVTYPA